jgi:O-Antigen ligase
MRNRRLDQSLAHGGRGSLVRSLADWILVLTFAGYPTVAALSYLFDTDNRMLSIVMRGIVLGLSIFVLAARLASSSTGSRSPFWIGWWIFWILYVVRITLDHFLNPAALKVELVEYYSFAVGVTLVPSVAVAACRVGQENHGVTGKLLLLAVAALILNLYLVFSGGMGANLSVETLRIETETLNPISIGHLGVTVFIVALWRRNQKSAGVAGFLEFAVSMAIAAASIVASGSRGPVLALVIVLVIYLAVLARHALSRWLMLVALVPIMAAIEYYEELQSLFIFERLSGGAFRDQQRSVLITEAINEIQKNPILGAGIEPLATYPHNLFIESFLFFGFFSGLLFFLLVLWALACARSISVRNPSRFWVALLFAQSLIGALFSGALYFSSTLWMTMALTVSLARSSQMYTATSGPSGRVSRSSTSPLMHNER